MPVFRDLPAARNLDFAPTLYAYYVGGELPMTGATVSMQVRLYPGAPGDPLLTRNDIQFRDDPAPTVARPDRRVLTLTPRFARANVEQLPGLHQPEPGEAQRFDYEIKVTYADGQQDLLWAGGFVLKPGVDRT